MTFHLPLDLEYWLVTTIAGSPEIFTALMLIVIAGLAAYFRMPNSITLIMIALFAVIMGFYTGQLLFIVILILGIVLGWLLSRVVK